jgi:hypothetical protein
MHIGEVRFEATFSLPSLQEKFLCGLSVFVDDIKDNCSQLNAETTTNTNAALNSPVS